MWPYLWHVTFRMRSFITYSIRSFITYRIESFITYTLTPSVANSKKVAAVQLGSSWRNTGRRDHKLTARKGCRSCWAPCWKHCAPAGRSCGACLWSPWPCGDAPRGAALGRAPWSPPLPPTPTSRRRRRTCPGPAPRPRYTARHTQQNVTVAKHTDVTVVHSQNVLSTRSRSILWDGTQVIFLSNITVTVNDCVLMCAVIYFIYLFLNDSSDG